MKKVLSIIMFLVISLLLLNGCGDNSQNGNSTTKTNSVQSSSDQNSSVPSTNGKEVKVDISNNTFDPQTVTINKGDTIIWTNQDSMAHTAAGNDFDSGNLDNGASFKFTFNNSGTYDYVCSYHASMKGQVIVK